VSDPEAEKLIPLVNRAQRRCFAAVFHKTKSIKKANAAVFAKFYLRH